MKRIISFALVVMMLASCFIISASADTAGQTLSDVVITPDALHGASLAAVNPVDSISKYYLDGENVWKFVGGNSTSYSGSVNINLWKGISYIPTGYKYVTVELYYVSANDTAKNQKPALQIATVSSLYENDEGGVNSNPWKEQAYKSTETVAQLIGGWNRISFAMDYTADTDNGLLGGTAQGGYLRTLTLSLARWQNATDTEVYIRSITFSMGDEVIDNVGAQQTLDYGNTYTVSAANTVPDKYNSETIKQTTFDGRSVWKYTYADSGTSYGSFYLPVNFNVQDYKYVTYDIYFVDSVITGGTPRVHADAGETTGYLDDGTSGYAIKSGEWQTVTLKLDAAKMGKVTRIQMFPLGEYMNVIHSGCTEYYMSDITFYEENPIGVTTQSVKTVFANSEASVMTWNGGSAAKSTKDNFSVFKLTPGTNYAGDIRVQYTTSSVDFSKYKYVRYSMLVVSDESSLTLTPTLEGRTAGRVDKNSDGTSTMSGQAYETNKWVTVTIKVSDDFKHSTSDLLFWPLGYYSKSADISFTECYVSAVSFFSEDPDATTTTDATQSIRFISVLKDDNLNKFSAVGYEITVNGVTQTVESSKVYTKVIGAGEEYTPDKEGGSYFSVVRIDGVPVGVELEFTVVAYVKTADGGIIKALPETYTLLANGMLK